MPETIHPAPIVEETQPWAAAPIAEEPTAVVARVAEHTDATIDVEESELRAR